MGRIARVAADLAKKLIQVHAVDATGKVVTTRALAAMSGYLSSRGELALQTDCDRWRAGIRAAESAPGSRHCSQDS